MTFNSLTRRRALAAGGAGLSLPILAACGASESDAPTPATDAGSGPSDVPTAEVPTAEAPTSEATGNDLVAAADVPVGGGVIPEGAGVVVTQPTEGDFLAFDATCTHSGCLVSRVTTSIDCLCHGSTFDLATGAPTGGPAPSPLASIAIEVLDGQVVRA